MTENITVTITTPSDRETVVTREFDAPAALVFDAVTKAELIKRWYGPDGFLDSCESDVRVGGTWRFAFTVGGKQMAKYGVYNEIDPPRRFVRTERFEGWEDYEALMTVEFVERNGKTTMTQHFVFPSRELRDTVMKTGLTPQGMSAFYERLDTLFAEMQR
ncbi:MAG TPA: SRPBCC domain-containing protein [Vicinamibacterales bacterium]|nr:SRPBCC domain-containing protein [Vicinamibacterales bacterium]